MPTEAEWEKAARGPDGFLYPWGNDWLPEAEDVKDAPVGSYPQLASPYGVEDLADKTNGEWVSDWYDENYYQISPLNNPTGPDQGDSKVVRGSVSPRIPATSHARRTIVGTIIAEPIEAFRCVYSGTQ